MKKLVALLLVVVAIAVLLAGCGYRIVRITPEPEVAAPAEEANSGDDVVTIDATCPTTAEAKVATGVDLQRIATEPCAFVWRGMGLTTTAVAPSGWQVTFHLADNGRVTVFVGDGASYGIYAATWRPLNADNVCYVFGQEVAFGQSEDPSFPVYYMQTSGAPTCQ